MTSKNVKKRTSKNVKKLTRIFYFAASALGVGSFFILKNAIDQFKKRETQGSIFVAKNFNQWNIYKQELHTQKRKGRVSERDVWWCSLGVNVGYEQDGKGKVFSRPVLVLRAINRHVFVGIPLSTQLKTDSPFHLTVSFQRQKISALILQIRTLSTQRLEERMGRFGKREFAKVKSEVRKRLNLETGNTMAVNPALAKIKSGDGRILIPGDAREQLGMSAGADICLWVEDGKLHMREGEAKNDSGKNGDA